MPMMNLPPTRVGARLGLEALRLAGTNIGRDAGEIGRVFDGMPDGLSRTVFTRTLRSVVDWRGQVVTMLDRVYLLSDWMPTMIMWGNHDSVIPVSHAYRAHKAVPGSRLEIYPEAGHFPHHTDPDRFVADLRSFVASTEPSRFDVEQWRARLQAGRPRLLDDIRDGLVDEAIQEEFFEQELAVERDVIRPSSDGEAAVA
jgi:hypothetical protein